MIGKIIDLPSQARNPKSCALEVVYRIVLAVLTCNYGPMYQFSFRIIENACLPSQGRRNISPDNLVRRLAVCQTRNESVGKRFKLLLTILRLNVPGLPMQRSISPFFNLTCNIHQFVNAWSITVTETYLHFAGPTRALNQLYCFPFVLFDKLKKRREEMLSVPSDPELCGHFDINVRLNS